jgi:hypothetical protein
MSIHDNNLAVFTVNKAEKQTTEKGAKGVPLSIDKRTMKSRRNKGKN